MTYTLYDNYSGYSRLGSISDDDGLMLWWLWDRAAYHTEWSIDVH